MKLIIRPHHDMVHTPIILIFLKYEDLHQFNQVGIACYMIDILWNVNLPDKSIKLYNNSNYGLLFTPISINSVFNECHIRFTTVPFNPLFFSKDEIS